MAADHVFNRSVGPEDFNLLASNFGRTGQRYATGDLDYDGTVGPGDFNILASNFGRSLPAAQLAAASQVGAGGPSVVPATTGVQDGSVRRQARRASVALLTSDPPSTETGRVH
jgi:hypothetical protein